MTNAQDLVTRAITQLAQTYERKNNLRQYWDFLNRNAGSYVGYRNGEFGYDSEMNRVNDELSSNGVQVNLRRRYEKNAARSNVLTQPRAQMPGYVPTEYVKYEEILATTRLCVAYMLKAISQKDAQRELTEFIDELDRNIGKEVITVREGVSALEGMIESLSRGK